MSLRTRRLATILAFLAGALVVTACRGSPPGGSAQTVTIALPHELGTLDPHAENTFSSLAVLSNLYESLVGTDADMRLKPALAERWESPDALTWIFHLRRGVRFHSGRPLRAADVVWSFERMLRDPDLGMRTYLQNVVAVRALDEATVQVRTDRSTRILLSKLALLRVVPEGASDLADRADGTGPYALARWTSGRSLELRRHEAYWGAPPAFPEARIVLATRAEASLLGIQEGRFDVIQSTSKLVESRVPASRAHVVRRDSYYLKYLGFDLADARSPLADDGPNPFQDVRVRQAIDLAIDRKRLVAELPGHAVPADQPVPRTIFGFDPALPPTSADPRRARSLMEEAGLRDGIDVVLQTRTIFADVARILRAHLIPIGFRVDVRVMPDPEFFRELGARRGLFWLSRWGCATGDASDFFEPYVHSANTLRKLGQNNYSGIADPALDRKIEASAEIEDLRDRQRALQELVRDVMERRLVVPLYTDQDVYAVSRALVWQPRTDGQVRAADIAPARGP